MVSSLHFGAQLVEGQALLGQLRFQAGQVHFVLLGQIGHRLVHRGVIDAQAAAGGVLQLHFFGDHLLQHLFFQHLARRRLLLSLQLFDRFVDAGLQVQPGDHVLVDHRYDAVHFFDRGGGSGDGALQGAGQQQGASRVCFMIIAYKSLVLL